MGLWDLAEVLTGKPRAEIQGDLKRKAGEFLFRVTPKCNRCGCLLLYHASGVGPCGATKAEGGGKCDCPGFSNGQSQAPQGSPP